MMYETFKTIRRCNNREQRAKNKEFYETTPMIFLSDDRTFFPGSSAFLVEITSKLLFIQK